MNKELGNWADKRKGFKHELVLMLVDMEFTYREAEAVVEAIFGAIKRALLEKDEVIVEGFGKWHVDAVPADQRRKWRFGKVVLRKPHKVSFQLEEFALVYAWDPVWKPHASWVEAAKSKPKARSRKITDSVARQEQEHRRERFVQYVRTIVNFFLTNMYAEDWNLFWVLRWNSLWFQSEAEQCRTALRQLHSIDDTADLIVRTTPKRIAENGNSRVIDFLCWYARWTTQLDVDGQLWADAERDAADRLRHSQFTHDL